MRLLILVQNYPPERGAVRYMHSAATALASRGHDVTVITGLPHYPTGVPYEGFGRWKPIVRDEDGVRVIRVPLIMASNRQLVRRVFGFISFVLSAMPWVLLSRRMDAVIASIPPVTVSCLGLFRAWTRRSHFVVAMRDFEPLATLRLRRMADSRVGHMLVRMSTWIYRRADQIIVVNTKEKDAAVRQRISPDMIETIPHGIDMEAFAAHMQMGIPFALPRRDGRKVALYLGTVGEVHDLRTLIASVADQRTRNLPLDFIIIGDGEQAQECQLLIVQEALDNFRLLPPIPPAWVPAVLAQADILVCSHHRRVCDSLGSKILEYCAAGKPVLVHGNGAVAELIQKIGNGLACDPGDAGALHLALHELLSNWDSWCFRAQRGIAYVTREFSQVNRSQRWEDILTAVTLRQRATG